MKISFQFQNGTSTITLAPEVQRERDLLRLFREGGNEIKAVAASAASPESLTIAVEAKPE